MRCCAGKAGTASSRVGFSRSGRNARYIGSLLSMFVLQLVGCTTFARIIRGATLRATSCMNSDSACLA